MSGPQTASAESDERLQIILSVMALTSVVGVAAMWKAVLTFLIGFAVLVPAGADVVADIPAGSGVGLDAPRCWIAAALALAVLGVAVKYQRRQRRFQSD